MGIVVAGPGRGEAFRVCVDKKKCTVHWAAEIKEAAKRKSDKAPARAKDDYAAQRLKWEEKERQRKEEAARWKKAAPALLDALAEKIRSVPALELVDLLVEELRIQGKKPDQLERGETLEGAVRFMAFRSIAPAITREWWAAEAAPKALKPFGIDAKQIVNRVAPKPKKAAEKKPAAPGRGKRVQASARGRKAKT